MNPLAARAFSGATATLGWQGTRFLLLLVSVVVLARLLAPADFGLVAMVTGVIGIGELIRDFGLSVASLQAGTLTEDEQSNLFWVNSAIGAALALAGVAASWPIAWLYGDARLVAITQALSVGLLVNGVTTQFKVRLNRDLRFAALGLAEVVPQALGVAVAIGIALSTPTYWALVAQVLTAAVLEALACIALAGRRPGRYRRDVPIGRFVRFGGALAGTQGLAYVSKNIDTVLLGIVRGPAELGVYGRAYQLTVLPLSQLTVPLSRVAIPVLSRLQDTPAAFIRFLGTAQFATVTVASILYGAMIGFGGPLVHLVLGGRWLGAVPILQVLAVSGLFRVLGQVPYWTFVTTGRTSRQLLVHLVGQPLIIAAIVIGTAWGGIGVATGCSAGYAAFWGLNLWWAGRVTGLPLGRLARSGLTLVVAFAVPVAAAGAVAVALLGDRWTALIAGGIPALAWVAAVLLGVPRYRAELVRFRRLARDRRAGADPLPAR